MYNQEDIPNEDELYYRIHKMYMREGELTPGVFTERESEDGERGMSTDWEKYSTPEASRNRARTPEDNGIVSLVSGDVRDLDIEVIHDPSEEYDNRAHTNLRRKEEPIQNSTKTRLKLLELSEWEIEVE